MVTHIRLSEWSRFSIVFIGAVWLGACSAETQGTGNTPGGWKGVDASGGGTAATGTSSSAGRGGVIVPTKGTGGEGIGGNDMPNEQCAGVNVSATRIKPWMLFVVDRSGSTDEEYPGSTSKWQALYDALMAPNSGVIAKLQSVAYFGIVLYDGGEENDDSDATEIICSINPFDPVCQDAGAAPSCPRLIIVKPKVNNFAAIDTAYRPAGPGSTTPTALALTAAYALVPPQQQILDQEIGPQFVVLCTDGEPNGCRDDNGRGGRSETDFQGPIDAVTQAAANGIKTFVVGIAVEDAAQDHLAELATIGDTGSPAFSPASKDDLVKAITQIVGGAIGCKVKLNGTVAMGKECSGYVELNSQRLTCNDVNGWKLADESHIELLGTACNSFVSDPRAILNAGFPCDAFVLQ